MNYGQSLWYLAIDRNNPISHFTPAFFASEINRKLMFFQQDRNLQLCLLFNCCDISPKKDSFQNGKITINLIKAQYSEFVINYCNIDFFFIQNT